MKLLVIVICLLSERFLMHSVSYRRFSWFGMYSQKMTQLCEKNSLKNPWVILAAIVLPLTLITGFIYIVLHGVLFGFMGLVLSIVIFFYCLGPDNAFYPLSIKDSDTNNALVGNYFSQVNSQLFAVVFWYIIAGPIAALAYRLIALSRDSKVNQEADTTADILEWLPARLTVLLFLLVGNFQRGFSSFCNFLVAKPEYNNKMISECGLLAVRTNQTDDVPMPMAESLVEHAAIVLLVFVALFTLVAWL